MPRPKRAAAARAEGLLASAKDKESQPREKTSPATPIRQLRRASFRSSRHGARDLATRRKTFEHIAQHHISANRDLPTARPQSSLTDSDIPISEPSQEHFALSGVWARALIDEPPDRVSSMLRVLLGRLQSITNLTEAKELEEKGEATGSIPSKDDNLHALAEALAAERFISHDDERVKLFTACCFAELLRICAPEPPLSQRKLNDICALFIEQLSVIVSSIDDMEVFRFSLLEQLATVKTFVIFCDDEDIVCDIFACFYAVSRSHQPSKVRQYLADILVSLLDEAEKLEKDVLDALLAPLVKALQYSPAAVLLAETVLRDAASFVQVPLCNILNASIRSLRWDKKSGSPLKSKSARRKSPAKKSEQDTSLSPEDFSQHHDHISELILAINRVSPEVLIYVIPNLESHLQSSDDAVRLGTVHLLSRLFVSRRDVTESYPSLFAEYLSRHRDVNAEIRVEVCSALGPLIVAQPKHREELDQIIRDRSLDRDEKVRIAAARAIGICIEHASDDLLKILATRLRDRRPGVRKEALVQLGNLYIADASHSRSTLSQLGNEMSLTDLMELDELDDSQKDGNDGDSQDFPGFKNITDPLETRIHRLSWLPNILVQSILLLRKAGDRQTAAAVEAIILETIPGLRGNKPLDLAGGIRRFSIFLCQLSESSFLQLTSLLQERCSIRNTLMTIAANRLNGRNASGADSKGETASATKSRTFSRRTRGNANGHAEVAAVEAGEIGGLSKILAAQLRQRAGPSNDVEKGCLSIATAVDLKIYERLVKAMDHDSSHEEFIVSSQDALSRFGSKTHVGQFVQDHVLSIAGPGVFSSSFFQAACNVALKTAKLEAPLANAEVSHDAQQNLSAQVLFGVLRFFEILTALEQDVLGSNFRGIADLVALEIRDVNYSADVVISGLKMMSRLPMDGHYNNQSSAANVLQDLALGKRGSRIESAAKLAKWAIRALISFNKREKEKPEALTDLVQSLASSLDGFSGDPASIVAPVAALAQLAKHAPLSFKYVALESFDFSRALLSGTLNSRICAFAKDDEFDLLAEGSLLHDDKAKEVRIMPLSALVNPRSNCLTDMLTDTRLVLLTELAARAVKLAVYSLPFVDNDDLGSAIDILSNISTGKHGDIFDLKAVYRNDSNDSEQSTDEADDVSISIMCAACRLCASRGILYLARHPKFFRDIPVTVFISTALLAQDEYPDVRSEFVEAVYNAITRKRLPLRWVVSLALMAVDPNSENIGRVRDRLTSLFRHRRRLYEKARQRGKKADLQILPESTVPELIWVLACLPGVDIDENAGYPESEKCLALLLDRLLESNEYAGVLNEYIESLSIAQVASEPDDEGPGVKTKRVGDLSLIATNILKKKQAGRKWTLSEHAGRISLPKDMYSIPSRNAETSEIQRPSLLDVARKFDGESIRGSGRRRPVPFVISPKIPALSSASKKQTVEKLDGDFELGSPSLNVFSPEKEDRPGSAKSDRSAVQSGRSGSKGNTSGRRRKRPSSDIEKGDDSDDMDRSGGSGDEKVQDDETVCSGGNRENRTGVSPGISVRKKSKQSLNTKSITNPLPPAAPVVRRSARNRRI